MRGQKGRRGNKKKERKEARNTDERRWDGVRREITERKRKEKETSK